jgi:hypothetical protein
MGKDKLRRGARYDRHVRLYAWLTNSPAWKDLSGNAVKLLVYLASFETGTNNGDLFMSERMAADGIGVSKRTAHRLFDELEEHGFIRATAKGYFSIKRGPATQWRLTWQSWPAASQGPTNEWRAWKPAEQIARVQRIPRTGDKSAPTATVHRAMGAISTPVSRQIAESAGARSDPHTIAIGGGRSCQADGAQECIGWWTCDAFLNAHCAVLALLATPPG